MKNKEKSGRKTPAYQWILPTSCPVLDIKTAYFLYYSNQIVLVTIMNYILAWIFRKKRN